MINLVLPWTRGERVAGVGAEVKDRSGSSRGIWVYSTRGNTTPERKTSKKSFVKEARRYVRSFVCGGCLKSRVTQSQPVVKEQLRMFSSTSPVLEWMARPPVLETNYSARTFSFCTSSVEGLQKAVVGAQPGAKGTLEQSC